MAASKFVRVFAVLAIICIVAEAMPLIDYFHNLEKKQNEIRMQQMLDFIAKNVPEGMEPPNPKIAEYETFKSNKMANFVDDGTGHLQFRQFRRVRLGDVLARHQAGI